MLTLADQFLHPTCSSNPVEVLQTSSFILIHYDPLLSIVFHVNHIICPQTIAMVAAGWGYALFVSGWGY